MDREGKMHLPGGVPTAHVDTFARDNLPPRELWAKIDYSTLPELRAYKDRMNAAVELLDRNVEQGNGPRAAIRFGDIAWTYSDLKDKADRIARVLVEDYGLVPGNRVMLRGPNNPMMAACWFAVLKAGGICVATMPLLRARELAFMIEKAQIKLALCDVKLADEIKGAQQRAPLLKEIAYFTAGGDGGDKAATLDAALAKKAGGFKNVDTAADDVALIAFTSGTTGTPKGTMHFHRDILAMCDCFPRYIFKGTADDVYTGTPPIAFTFGLGAILCFPMRFGASVVFLQQGSPDGILETIQKYKCTALYTAPTMFRQLVDKAKGYDISSLTKCVSAGETLPLPTWEAFYKATGIKIIDGIGSTEMIHIFISASGDDIRPGATGKPIPGYEACIMDEKGNELPAGQPGLLAVRGPTACRYLDNLERQRGYVKNGWNLPGDIYMKDADGYYHYQARADDMIISAGYNIAGPEVEAVLLDHPKVKECAVIGWPDAERGYIVKAFVVLRNPNEAGPALAKELQDFVKAEIAPYKYPRAIDFIADLPRTETGKVQRFKLREGAPTGTTAKAS
jgi:2-aminobenzoate-CoA ligase